VASYGFLSQRIRIPTFASLAAAILLGKLVYYTMKSAALGAGLLAGSLISTPVGTQAVLALGTAAAFSLVEYFSRGSRHP